MVAARGAAVTRGNSREELRGFESLTFCMPCTSVDMNQQETGKLGDTRYRHSPPDRQYHA